MEFLTKASISNLILILILNTGCEQQRNDVTQTAGGVCVLSSSGQAKLCIDFPQSISANTASSTCDTEASQRGYSGLSYLSGHANTCSNTANQTEVGHCTLSNSSVYRHGNSQWNTTTASADCSTIGGTWAVGIKLLETSSIWTSQWVGKIKHKLFNSII